jgi:2-oxo-3-hexenedioate decarboxylase
MDDELEQLARDLDRAAREHAAIPQWAGAQPLTLQQAYEVQSRVADLRCAHGDEVIGLKQAFTNRAMMKRMGVAEQVTGLLCRTMEVPNGGPLSLAHVFAPRVEVEVMFRLARPVPPDATPMEALACVDAVAPAIEVVDSRYRDFRFSAHDAVADNASACAFVVGAWLSPPPELGQRAVTLEVDGTVAVTGDTANILDHPLLALCNAVRLAARDGRPLASGSLVLGGSAIDPFPVSAGQRVHARIEGLGAVGFVVSGG